MAHRNKDDSAKTRAWCVFGLVVSWIVGMSALIAGGICLYGEIRDGNAAHIQMSNVWREVLPLGLNVLGMLSASHLPQTPYCALH